MQGMQGNSPNPAAIALRQVGKALAAGGRSEAESAGEAAEHIRPMKYHRGGKVRKTGPAVLKRGERVIPADKRKKVERLMKKSKIRMKDKRKKVGRSSNR
jgi:hypothetical protein